MLKRIVSGGQIGADRAGLIAAKRAGLDTGGWMPKGFKAKDGIHPEFTELYGIKEHNSPLYPPRTHSNVADSDGTVRFAVDFNSAGEICTLNAITSKKKPHFDVDILGTTTPRELADWIITNNIETLNVAGNAREELEEFVIAFLLTTIEFTNSAQSPQPDMNIIAFTKVALPFGWMGNMSPYQIEDDGIVWPTTEALFQANRFPKEGKGAEIRELIRSEKSPMAAKMVAKKHIELMIIKPGSEQDIDNMRKILQLKLTQHPSLKEELAKTKDALIIEDCTKRKASIWGAQLINGQWVGDNLLGKLWMELRHLTE